MDTNLSFYLNQERELELLQAAAEGKIDFSLESTGSYSEFFDTIGRAVKNTFKSIFNIHTTANMLSPVAPGSTLISLLETRGINAIRSTTVYRLPKQSVSMLELASVLDTHFMELIDIQKRLYEPALKWTSNVVNDGDFAERVWFDKNVKFKDVAELTKVNGELFQPSGKRNDDSEFIEFIAMYPTIREFQKVHDKVTDIHEHLAQLDLVDLQKLEKRIVDNIDKLIRMSNDPEETFVMPQETKVMLVKVFRNMITETEYLVALAFQLNSIIGAWNNTVEKLKKDYM